MTWGIDGKPHDVSPAPYADAPPRPSEWNVPNADDPQLHEWIVRVLGIERAHRLHLERVMSDFTVPLQEQRPEVKAVKHGSVAFDEMRRIVKEAGATDA